MPPLHSPTFPADRAQRPTPTGTFGGHHDGPPGVTVSLVLSVRLGGVDDVDRLGWASGAAQREQWRRHAERPTVALLVAEEGTDDEKRLLGKGFLVCADVVFGPGTAWLELLSVDPQQRGRGVGTALILAAQGEARRRGCHTLAGCVADDNPRARALYERLGFVAAGRWTDHVHHLDEAGLTVCRDEPGVLVRRSLV